LDYQAFNADYISFMEEMIYWKLKFRTTYLSAP